MKKRSKLKKGLAILLSLAMVMGLMPGVGAQQVSAATATWTYPTKTPTLTWEGSGTAEDPYIITTAQELANMSYIVNAGLQNSDGKNYYELCYKLGGDIDIGGKQWVPIGGIKNGTSYLYDFKGSFDGDNHTISNLTFNAVNTNYETLGRSGLFYEISGNAEIKNVKLENVDISMKGVSGALVATIDGGYTTFSNCHVLSGTITSTSTVMQYFGGLIGASTCNSKESSITITNCTNRATVTGSSTYNDYVGGIIGYTRYGEINISNCYNYGTLSSKYYVGGIVAYTYGNGANITILNCGNEGSINSKYYAGGIVGIATIPDATDSGHRFTISGCYNKGAITSTNSSRAGGIVGCVGGKTYLYLIIERCYSAGTVTSDIYGSHIYDTESENYSTQSVSVKNCVYTGDKVAYFGTGDNDAFNRKVTAEELESGKATVYLNQGLSEDNLIWYQNLSDPDKDNYPVTDSTHSKVYASDYCMVAAIFSNTAPATMNNSHNLEHVAQVDAKCGISGLKEHYKCNICGELYSDANGTNIVTSVELVIPPTATEHNHVDGICTVCGDLITPQQDADGYYLIYTLGELISYADMVTPDDGAAWIPMNEPTEASQKVRLMADIDMSSVYNAETGKSWNPIGGGDGGAYFKGDFDGNGHTISGLYINSTTVQYAGLFGRLMFGVCCVHDLTLKDVSINAPNATAAGTVAGFVDSYKKSPTIKNCMVEGGTIIGKESVGGIAGKTSSGQLLSATEEGDPILIDSGYISAIQNCGNKATVTATTNAGGLSGSGPVWIDSSYNSGTVTGTTSGQITGSLSEKSKVNNCYYLGTSDTAFGVNSTDAGYITNVAYKSAEEFASGEVAYLLNNGITDGSQAWYQNLGESGDTYPVLKKEWDGGNTVYQNIVYSGCSESNKGNATYAYANAAAEPVYGEHIDADGDGVCDTCSDVVDAYKHLHTLIATADTIQQGDYSDASYQTLQNALAEAKALTDASTDAELTAAYEALTVAKNGLKTARATVTTSSNPANSGILTGDGKYAVGETVTLTAKAVSGYKFLGWYLDINGEPLSTETVYEVYVTEETAAELNYIAKYEANAQKKLSVTVGNGTVAYRYQNGIKTGIWSNNLTDNEFASGTYFTVTAQPDAGYTFLYWTNSEGRVLTEADTYSFYLGDDLKLQACYKRAVESYHYVIFKDMNGKILWTGDVAMSQTDDQGATYYGTVALPSHGIFTGYTFSSWKDASGNVISTEETGTVKITEDIVLYADYEAVTGLKLTVDGVEQDTTYAYASKVTVTADESREGKYFSGWYNADKLVSESREYTFYITENTSLTAKYEGESVIVQQPIVNMTMSDRTTLDNGKQTLVMNVTWSVPEGYTFVEGGFVRSLVDEYSDKLTLSDVDGTNVKKNEAKLTTSEGTYIYTLTLSTASVGKNVYAVGYITYKNDATGEVTTIYTNKFTSTAANS
ncbi:MAG: InlB B-repeat-containing protein [Lachnospiraceae bacterium]